MKNKCDVRIKCYLLQSKITSMRYTAIHAGLVSTCNKTVEIMNSQATPEQRGWNHPNTTSLVSSNASFEMKSHLINPMTSCARHLSNQYPSRALACLYSLISHTNIHGWSAMRQFYCDVLWWSHKWRLPSFLNLMLYLIQDLKSRQADIPILSLQHGPPIQLLDFQLWNPI